MQYNNIGGEIMALKYKIDVIEALKSKGYTSYKIRKDKLLSESTVQKLRKKQPVSWENLETLCRLLEVQPADIIVYEKD